MESRLHKDEYMKYFLKHNRSFTLGSSKGQRSREEILHQGKLSSIWQFKVEPTIHAKPVLRLYMGMCCQQCQPNSKNAFVDEVSLSMGLRDILEVKTKYGPIWKRAFCHLLWVTSLKPVVQYPDVTQKVIKDARVESAIDRASQLESEKALKDCSLPLGSLYETFTKKNKKRVLDIIQKMAGTVRSLVIRFVSYALHKTLRHLVSAIRIHKGQIEVLKRAERTGTPIVYLPLHKSHLDYILLTFVLYDYEMRAPLIAAGDNLRLPMVGSFAQQLGAFFIRRRLDCNEGEKDLVYRAVLHSYVAHCLRAGHSIEIFIEGGRSRSGKPAIPKAGLLGVIYDTYNSGFIEDVLIVPVAMSYERIPDGSFVTEELGKPKKPESLCSVMKAAWRLLTGAGSKTGAVRVEFCQPFSLAVRIRLIIPPKISKIPTTPIFGPSDSPPGSPLNRFPHNVSTPSVTSYNDNSTERRLVDSLARHVVYTASRSLAATCTGLLSYLLLTRFRNGASLIDIVKAFDEIREEVVVKKVDLAFRGESSDVVIYAAELLGSSVVQVQPSTSGDQIRLVPVLTLPYVLELSYHANTVIQVFLSEAILSLAIVSNLSPVDFSSNPIGQVPKSREALLASSLQLCDILRYEFIVSPPCQDNEKTILDTLDDFKSRGLVSALPDEDQVLSETDKWAKRISKRLEWGNEEDENENIDDMEFEDTKIMVNVSLESKRIHLCQANTIRPIIDSYCLIVKSVEKMTVEPVEEKSLLQSLQEEIATSCEAGITSFRESVALDNIKNCLRLLLDWNVLQLSNHENIRYYNLNPHFFSGLDYSQILDRLYQFKTVL